MWLGSDVAVAAALIQPLAQELTYDAGVVKTSEKTKKTPTPPPKNMMLSP